MMDAGILLKQTLIWVKNSMVMGCQDYQWQHEPCLYGWKEGAAHKWYGDRTHKTVIEDRIDFKKLKKSELLSLISELYSGGMPTTILREDKPLKSIEHPTMKPVKLIAYLMKNSSKTGDLICDAFLGSGTTMVAAHQLNRKCYGMELDPKYCQVIVDRMHKLDPDLPIKINGKLIEV
jgi:DNA modification methylase